jgi:hypothetical protein
MKPVIKIEKQAKPLPGRLPMQALNNSQRTLLDYSKATQLTTQTPNLIQNLRRPNA